ncbi:T-box transcription factor TBX5 [Zootermopsis nevadensis]|uniref:T-box transcription factor TBX5 n=2 Tax=Zootermopsis nevadensis TaxID=136037 RepID=A0A067QHB6_ZOONE|nr:T-box transcription factor TBX5 [Zootermopsis nevadensis]
MANVAGCSSYDAGHADAEGHWELERAEELKGVKMALLEADLWRKFHGVDTEMIITKSGRNMFPVLAVEVSGLEPDALYVVLMEMCLSSDRRYKFVGAEWKAMGRSEPQMAVKMRCFIHQDSPATGTHWMRDPIKMKAAKLTNNPVNNNGHVVLTSMHKYIPHIHVVKTSDYGALSRSPKATFLFPETEFIAVTAYQNERVTILKIDNNPFAKGFRENGLSYVKRKQNEAASNRKRHYPERSPSSSLDNAQSRSPLLAEDFNNNSQNTLRVPSVIQDQNECNPVDLQREAISAAVAMASPYNAICQRPYYPFPERVCMFPCMLPSSLQTPPPLPPHPSSLYSSLFIPIPYNFNSAFHHQLYSSTQPCITELNQPYDYSLREKSN